ncbi:TIGR02449 family protein [Gilvimarinus sp. F26214L]|uniref:TIGR02449 family protein n=1 Tax=Gilvimarinus sp. DZF01 TaxID=3461371 RepID=UPI00404683B1
MPGSATSPLARPSLSTLEAKLDRLVQLCEQLNRENRRLREQQSGWLREKTRLIEKNELARTRVEAMISRLKSLEAES